MDRKDMLSDAELDALLHAASQDRPEPGPDLMARLVADATDAMPDRPVAAAPRRANGRSSAFAGFAAFIGGWRGAAALTACAVAGLWIGFTDPAAFDTYNLLQTEEEGLGLGLVSVSGLELLAEGS
ncbi:hypothetical protein [Oceanomicrobium pacificus]|uniref:Dihydroorotate dehydrogenase n=1 Tax=Oceanomicrobium pacificus TaxID=2692916 RepID=A0A6B0TRL5_9RHOB|nr:hypothetical protein [Oceanomicrobium pacificus]MXU63842.1 hypothetical protein [Oceanomicrobium pacificus]